jgi:hypothetical protein
MWRYTNTSHTVIGSLDTNAPAIREFRLDAIKEITLGPPRFLREEKYMILSCTTYNSSLPVTYDTISENYFYTSGGNGCRAWYGLEWQSYDETKRVFYGRDFLTISRYSYVGSMPGGRNYQGKGYVDSIMGNLIENSSSTEGVSNTHRDESLKLLEYNGEPVNVDSILYQYELTQ